MILLISTCKEKLHNLEFVKPIEDILKKNNLKFISIHFSKLNRSHLKNAKKVIICGTSLKDNSFADYLDSFNWIKEFDKPLLGICAGMQIIGLIYGGKLKKNCEIGFFVEEFKDFLSLKEKQKVFHLHNFFVDFSKLDEFQIYSKSKIPQAVKHKEKDIFAVLFHPEVRQKDLILEFVKR